MNPTRWPSWKIDAAGVAIVLGLIAAAYLAQIGPAWQARETAALQAAELGASSDKQSELGRTSNALREQLKQLQTEVEAFPFRLEAAGEINARLGRIAAVAGEKELTIEALESGESKSFPRYGTMTIRLRGQGTYAACGAFVKRLRETLPDVGVTSLHMSATAGKSGTEATIQLDLVWYTAPVSSDVKR